MEHLAEMLEMKEESNVIGVRLAFIVEAVMEQVTTHVQWVIIVQEIQLRLHSTHALLDIILKRWAQEVSLPISVTFSLVSLCNLKYLKVIKDIYRPRSKSSNILLDGLNICCF